MKFHEPAPLDPQQLTKVVRQRREASFRPDRVLRLRLRERDGGVIPQVHKVLQELHPGE